MSKSSQQKNNAAGENPKQEAVDHEVEIKTEEEELNAESVLSQETVNLDGIAESPEIPEELASELTLEQVQEQLEEARAETSKAKDDLLRVQAEMQNLRRRTELDIEKAHKYGQERFSTELLGVLDNLERALEAASAEEDERVKAIYDGVELTCKSFIDCLNKNNIEPVDPEGEPFDPTLHQAVTMQENAEVEPNTVLKVLQKGYTLHGRVMRPAMVMVSKAAVTEQTGSEQTNQDQVNPGQAEE
ncbi:MAG: nucleotide exchange factor GrpE [Gammaproteobacteria bacterium]|nr:nucleotide exchange factor GrpE [Gammaproteobacteria bacterium]